MPAGLVLGGALGLAVDVTVLHGRRGRGRPVLVAVAVTVAVEAVGHGGVRVDDPRHRVHGLAQVALVLDDHVERRGEHLGGQLLDAEDGEGAGPVDGLGDAGGLAQLELAQGADDLDQAHRQRLREPGLLGADDLQLALGAGVVEEEVQAPALEGRGEVAGVVGGEHHVGRVLGAHRADLGDRDLELGEQLEQHGLQRLVGAVHLVDEQHDGLLGGDRLEQRARGEEPLGEEDGVLGGDAVHGLVEVDGVLDDLTDLLPQDLGVEQLLAVVPLVERLGLVLALVALQAQQAPAGRVGQALGQLGLADPGRALEQHGLEEPGLEEHGGGQPFVDQVADVGEAGPHRVDVGEVGVLGSDGLVGGETHADLLGGRTVGTVPAACWTPPGPRAGCWRDLRRGGRPGRRSCSGRPRGAPSRRCTPWRCPGCRRRRGRGG